MHPNLSALLLAMMLSTGAALKQKSHDNGERALRGLQYAEIDHLQRYPQPERIVHATPMESADQNGNLRIHYFASPTHARCGDGSLAAVYSNQHVPDRDPTKHVFFVMKGSACFSDSDCQEVMQDMSYKLSSKSWPTSVDGLSILSDKPELNPTAHNYTFWMLPYCSQDAYLGYGEQDPNGLIKAGSAHFTQAMEYWLQQTQNASQQELLVVGSSAGALGVLNHMKTIRAAAQIAHVQELGVVLDSAPLNVRDIFDEVADSAAIEDYLESYVDPQAHPMCFQTDDEGTPCCLSTHCMLRKDPVVAKWGSEKSGDRMLLINSMYDPFELSRTIDAPPEEEATAGEYIQTMQETNFVGGQRQQRVLETASFLNAQSRPANATTQFAWAYTSCVMHAFLVPATFDVEVADCDAEDTACRNGTAVGRVVDIYRGQNLILWNDPDLWATECVSGESIQSIIEHWVVEKTTPQSSHLFLTFGDKCHGANCVSDASNASNAAISPCQQFLELEDSFVPLSPYLKWIVAGLMGLGALVGYLVGFNPTLFVRKSGRGGRCAKQKGEALAMRNLNVYDPRGDKFLLSNVSFSIPKGAVTAICGKSGAGKTTLLRAMVGQTNPNLTVSVGESNFEYGKVCYVRQEDNCSAFKKMLAREFLENNALLYNASPSRLEDVKSAIKAFQDSAVADLSGGQRKRLAVCSALLMTPALIVLDEPLTGLDSVSANEFLQFIVATARDNGCSIVMTVHSPSDEIARSFDKLMIVEKGHLVVNTPTAKLWSTCKATPADDIHALLESAESSRLHMIDDTCEVKPGSAPTDRSQAQGLVTSVLALMARLRKEFGSAYNDFVRLPATIFALTYVLSWYDGSLNQALFATIFCLAASYNVFQYKISQSCKLWHMHRSEILDGRISYTCYMLASHLYQFSPALLSLIPSLAIAYATLGWGFATFVVQYIFSSMYLLISLQAGRCLSLWFDGDHTKYIKPFSLLVVLNYMFSGALVPISKFPTGLHWLYVTSYTYWAASGALLNQLQFGASLAGDSYCTTAISCIVSDNSIIGRYLGYHPRTTSTKSLAVLGFLYALLIMAELLVGTRGNRRFAMVHTAKPETVKSDDDKDPSKVFLSPSERRQSLGKVCAC